jgi:VIT family
MSFTPARDRSDAGARSAVRRAGIGRADAREAIFGSFDGMTSTLGVVAGLLATRATAPHIVAGAIGIAVAATIGMGAGQYLSDEKRSVRKAVVMAVATLAGSVLPALPFIFGRLTGVCLGIGRDHAPCRGGDRALPRLCGHLCDLASRLGAHGRPFDRRCMSGRERACRVSHIRGHPRPRPAGAASLVSTGRTTGWSLRASEAPAVCALSRL